MQYKLFKYLRTLDETDKLNQQIFVTTHSSNISAVAGIDNMYMLSYERSNGESECKQQSLAKQFCDEIEAIPDKDNDNEKNDNQQKADSEKTEKQKAKDHLTKFLDATRSDMLFADKVILVEGIAERLLLPLFIEKCNCSYEDEHISIVEIGGKHFEHFIELFNGNAVHKKILCITDKDFKWVKETGGVNTLSDYADYATCEIPHIKKLLDRFPIDNFHIVTQAIGGRTFEYELYLSNLPADKSDFTMATKLMKIVANATVLELLEEHNVDFASWDSHRPTAANSVVSAYLDVFKAAITRDAANKEIYERLFFAEMFLYYANNCKGDVALNILTDDEIANNLIVPKYIKEGLEWLLN